MTTVTLASPVVSQSFPAGTADTPFAFAISGTKADGTAVSLSSTSATPSATFDLDPGTYTGVVSKLGVSSLPSAPFTITAPTPVTLSVPDPTQPATLG